MSFFFPYTLVLSLVTVFVLGVFVFVGRTKLDELDTYFSANPEFFKRKQRWKRNQRFKLMCLIIDILAHSKGSVKEGFVTEAELAAIPLSLKRWAVWPYHLAIMLVGNWGYWCTWL